MAVRFGKLFGNGAGFWANLQADPVLTTSRLPGTGGGRIRGEYRLLRHNPDRWPVRARTSADFAWFATTRAKSRLNFLALLRAGATDYGILVQPTRINVESKPAMSVERVLALALPCQRIGRRVGSTPIGALTR